MVKRYNQYCPMSYSLDVIGERWSLHIVRDLMYGALRFTDLQSGLPNIASNVLAKRIRQLEAAGVVEQQRLPPPFSVNVYALTERGKGLKSVIAALTSWGISYLQPLPPEDDYVGYVPLRGYLATFFSPAKADGITLTCEIHTEAYPFYVKIENQAIEINLGAAPTADTTIYVRDLRTLVGVLNGVISLDDALASNAIRLGESSSSATLKQFVHVFDSVDGE